MEEYEFGISTGLRGGGRRSGIGSRVEGGIERVRVRDECSRVRVGRRGTRGWFRLSSVR